MGEYSHDPVFQNFIAEAKTHGVVWTLANGEDLLVVESVDFEDTDVMPFWSSQEAALVHCSEEWSDYKPEAIPLDVFCEGWLQEMYDDGVLIGTNWDRMSLGEVIARQLQHGHDDLAAQIREQATTVTPMVQQFGALKTIDHVGQQDGADLFRVVFEKQATDWVIAFNDEDQIAALLFRPASGD